MEKNMNALAQHLAALNAEKLAWVAEDPTNRWTGLYVEELDFWAEYGVYTVAQFKRHENETLFWDMYKDATGCRPRHVNLKDMTDEQLEREIDLLGRMIEDEIKRDEEWEAEMIAFAQEDAEIENEMRDEMPLPIDYIAANYQEGWL
jgi:hypothetical protein